MESLVTEFGSFHCEGLYTLGWLRSSVFVSQIVGIVFFMFLEESIGKRRMYLVGLFSNTVGGLALFLSQSMEMAVVGQIILGFSSLTLLRFFVSVISDATQPALSEKFISSLTGFYGGGGVIGPLAYSVIRNWRYVVLYFYGLPFGVQAIYFYRL